MPLGGYRGASAPVEQVSRAVNRKQ